MAITLDIFENQDFIINTIISRCKNRENFSCHAIKKYDKKRNDKFVSFRHKWLFSYTMDFYGKRFRIERTSE